MSSLQKLVQTKGLPPLPQQLPSFSHKRSTGKRDFSPKPWTDYFEEKKQVAVGNNNFQYYESGPCSSDAAVVFLHGGGFSGLSWALLTKALRSLVDCRCIALDMRGHGGTTTEDDGKLAADILANDVCSVISELVLDCPVILIGHSMGGAIAVHTAVTNLVHRLAALIVIDVVEGTALDALKSMHHVLHNRPQSFDSIEKANEWCVRSGYIHNLESARVSMVGQLVRKEVSQTDLPTHDVFTISEDPDTDSSNSAASNPSHKYVWRIDLSRTEPFWEGWFQGMSSLFLSVPVPKVLMLAGVDRLDRELSIGQMQGKFQIQVMSRSGHAVHEDKPDAVAEVIAAFLVRHKLSKRR